MRATPQATEQQQSTLRTEPYCTVLNAPPGQFKYATSWKLKARCGQGEHASHGMLGRKTRSRGQAIQCTQIVVSHIHLTSKLKLPMYNIGSQQSYYFKKKFRHAFGQDRTHKTRYTLPRPLVVLVGVQRNLESPFIASSTYIVPYKKPLMVNSIASCWL